jgi:arylsulfatase A
MQLCSRLATALCLASAATLAFGANAEAVAGDVAKLRPNIVYILCDDLGYGDVQAFNPKRGKIATPSIDRLAAEGMRFTDAHSGSSVCTPTRYGILTGRYAWRTRLQSGVLNGMSPPLIAGDRMTVAELLKGHGYATAMIGKWHLGLEFGENKWKDPIRDGPRQHGFDSFFGISASLDMPPFVYIENDRVTEIPSETKRWIRSGPAGKNFEAIDVLPELAHRAVEYLASRKSAETTNDDIARPFFLYLALTSPHTPILPTEDWRGKSGLGLYGDFVMETDWAVGEVLRALDAANLADNTLVIFTSDNGCSPAAGVTKLEGAGHFPSGPFRGYKADIWDGGHRIPFIARWPDRIPPASQSDALICLTDFMATCANILGVELPASAAEDSVSMLPALRTQFDGVARESVVHHSIDGYFAIRKGKWKLAMCRGSGGWSAPREPAALRQHLPDVQLYDMTRDESEQRNVAVGHRDVVSELTSLLKKTVDDGRSTPGPIQSNDARIHIRKQAKNPG